MQMLKSCIRWLLIKLFRVEVSGLENFGSAGARVLVVANHTSFLDAVLLWAFLPDDLTFAINTYVARLWWLRPVLWGVHVFPMDPTNPLSMKALIRYLEQDRKAVIFPEGRITVTGSLMKIYDGPGLVADRSHAAVLPVRIDGAQYTIFSRLRGRVRLRWFPKIRLQVLPARHITPPAEVEGRERRKAAGRQLSELMTEMVFTTSDYNRTLFAALLDARRTHGGRHKIVEDIQRQPLTYNQLVTRALLVGGVLAARTDPEERVGLLLPGTTGTVATFLGLSAFRRVPAMLNYSFGGSNMLRACETAALRYVVTSRRFLQAAKLSEAESRLSEKVTLIYIEDLVAGLKPWTKLRYALLSLVADFWYASRGQVSECAEQPAVVLFTSGSEGTPKGVVLSHANLLANRAQLAARIDFNAQDIILNALPLFHSFGLTAGTLLPLFSGMRTFFYPSPLHYRIVPEIAYDTNATILFGTNTFLAGYARFAHPYDFYSLRYVFAGAERLQDTTRRVWMQKFGIRIFEGYGATETAPVLAANTPMDYAEGSVGRLLPGISHRLEPVPGIAEGGRLLVRGPNVMLGYMLHGQPGIIVPPEVDGEAGWYDTGDIVTLDAHGYVRIQGRAKRFAKVAGEMVSLGAVEDLAANVWPGAAHAAITLPDVAKGEQVLLVSTQQGADRGHMLRKAKELGVGEINVPKVVLCLKSLPLLGSGKNDYAAVTALALQQVAV